MGCLRFGAFEFDPASGELRKNGLRIQLHGQPASILGLLLEKAGDLVTRQEFKDRLWPADTFVDFERGLNAGVARLRAALGESAGQPRFMETVPRRGYRFIAPVGRIEVATGSRQARASTLTARRLIVLPFDLLQPDPQIAFLGFSLPEAISGSLAGLPALIVRSNRVVAQLAPASAKLRVIAAEADVDAVMTGTLLRSGEQLRVSAQLIAVPEGTVVWTHVAQVPVGEIFELQDELTRRIIASLVPSVTGSDADLGQRRDVPATARAYEFYLRANHLAIQMRDLPLARDMYRKCVEEDPDYAPAWARLARCHRILAKFRAGCDDNATRAEEAFQRAFALNPRCPGIHSQYAYHEADQGRAREAITRLLRELHDNPNDPDHYAALVYVCRYAGLVQASLAAHEAAIRLDRGVRTSVMNTHFVMGNHAAALASSTDNVGYMEAMILEALGQRSEALERVRRREGLPPLMCEWMRMLELFVEDRREEAAERVLQIDRQGVDPEGFYYRARLLARMSSINDALATLEQALQRGYHCAPALLTDPYLDSIRSTVRFRELAEKAVHRSDLARVAFLESGGPDLLPEANR